MPHVDDIVRAYRNADAQERMDTYLAYPGLRVLFEEIEREEERGSPAGEAEKGKGRLRRVCRPFAAGWRTSHS